LPVFCRCKYQGYQDFLKPNKKRPQKNKANKAEPCQSLSE